MNNYKVYLKDKNSIFHQTEKNILNLISTKDLKNKDTFLSSKVKNRLIDSLLYMHQYKQNCEVRKNFRKKYNLEMKGGKTEMMTLQNIIAPTDPGYTNADLEKQFQEVTKKIFEAQPQPNSDRKSNLFTQSQYQVNYLPQPRYDLEYKIDHKQKQKQEQEQKNNMILEFLKNSGKTSSERSRIFKEIEKNKRKELELTNYLKILNITDQDISGIINIKKKDLNKIELKQDLDQINQLTDIITESKNRTSLNYIKTSAEDVSNKLMRQDMHNPNNLIFNSINEYDLEFVNLQTQTQQKCKYQLKNETAIKNNGIRKKYKEYQKYEDLIPIIESTKIRDPNHSYAYIYDVDQLINNHMGLIDQHQHTQLYNKIDDYRNSELGNNTLLNSDFIKNLNQSLLGLQLLYEIQNINNNINQKPDEVDFLKKKLYSPGIKYARLNDLINFIGVPNVIDGSSVVKLLGIQVFSDDIFLDLDTGNATINQALISKGIVLIPAYNNLLNYFSNKYDRVNPANYDANLELIKIMIEVYSYIVNNNKNEVNLDSLKKNISSFLTEIVNKEDLLKDIENQDTSCKFNTQCGEDNLCHLKKCIYEVLASSGKLKGELLTGLEIRKTVEERFKKMYPEHEKENFVNECNWLDGKVINFLEQEYNIRIILINKFDYNFNQELIEYNDFQNNESNFNKKDENKKGTLENLDEISKINKKINNIGIKKINNNNISEALQSKFSVKNKQGSIFCNQFKYQNTKNNFNKVVFIIYNTDENYQLLKINEKTQLSINEVPIELKKFVNNSCSTSEPILKISNSEILKNKLDYPMLEKKILEYLYKNGLGNNIEKVNYFRNLINMYQEQDDIIDINNKLNGLTFKLENDNLTADLNINLDIKNIKYINLTLTRNGLNLDAVNHLRNPEAIEMVNIMKRDKANNINLGDINEKYSIIIPVVEIKVINNKIIIESNVIGFLNSFNFLNTYFKINFKIKVINHEIRTEYLFKLFDFICYLNKEKKDYFNSNLKTIISKNSYLQALTEKIVDLDQFLTAFTVYKKLELEKLYNSKLFSEDYLGNIILRFVYLTTPDYLFDTLRPYFINYIDTVDSKFTNYVKSTKLYKLIPLEINKIKDDMNKLNLEYKYLFSLYIRDFLKLK
jgi:hypothetical protein